MTHPTIYSWNQTRGRKTSVLSNSISWACIVGTMNATPHAAATISPYNKISDKFVDLNHSGRVLPANSSLTPDFLADCSFVVGSALLTRTLPFCYQERFGAGRMLLITLHEYVYFSTWSKKSVLCVVTARLK